MLCEYGCGKEAQYQLKNGKWCCSQNYQSCSVIKNKNSSGLKKAHKDGRCTTKHFEGKRGWRKGKTIETDPRLLHGLKTDEEVLKKVMVANSSYSRFYLKKRLLRTGLKKNKCEICGFKGEWNKKPIIFILDHINGVNNDHRFENLRMICPMCNTQLETFGSRNKVFQKNNTGV